MKITSHAVLVVVVDPRDDGAIFLDRMDYTKHGRTSVRHVMETGESGENIEKTLYTAVMHELAGNAVNFKYDLLSDMPIHNEFGPCERHPGGTHWKVVFPIRTASKLRDTHLVDGDETLGPISVVEARQLLRETEGRTVPFHVRGSRAALAHAAVQDRDVYAKYTREVEAWKPAELTEEQMAAIEAYPGKW